MLCGVIEYGHHGEWLDVWFTKSLPCQCWLFIIKGHTNKAKWNFNAHAEHFNHNLQLTILTNSLLSSDWVNSSPCATYMRQWPASPGSPLVRVIACRLFGTKPLPEPMQIYCQLDLWEQISVKFELIFWYFHSRKCINAFEISSVKWRPFCPGGDELTLQTWA